MIRERLRPWARPLAAAGMGLIVAIGLGRAYTQRRLVEDARAALKGLGALEEVHKRLYGEYTQDPSRLADLTDDWRGFMASLDALLDFRAGFAIRVEKNAYRIEAHARDRRRTVVVWEGPPKLDLAGPGAPRR